MRVSVFGLGWVGSVTAASLAKAGHDVVGVDVDVRKVRTIESGRSPVAETGLDDLISSARAAGRLRVTLSARDAVAESDVALLCVGTPTGTGGKPDLSALWRVGCEIGAALDGRRDFTIVVRSTVPPGTTEGLLARAIERRDDSGRTRLAANPEFMREGSALSDFASPAFTLVGCRDARTASFLRALHAVVGAPFVETSIGVAEMTKYVSNAFHALKICFTNEIASLAVRLGVDADEAMRIFRMDHRLNVSEAYLRPGFAFGGSCLGKDVRALVAAARSAGIGAPLLESIVPSNDLQVRRGVEAVLATGRERIGVVGLAFKPGTDDVRESPFVELVSALLGNGLDVRVLDRVVAASDIFGANRRFLESRIPDVGRVLCSEPASLAAHADTLVLGHGGADAEAAARLARPGCSIVDLRGALRPPAASPVRSAAAVRTHPTAAHRASAALLVVAIAVAGGLFASSSPRGAASAQAAFASLGPGERLVPAGGDLQDALDRALPGETIVLEPGAPYVGPFVLPRKPGAQWITIRAERLPPAGHRVGKEHARRLPALVASRGSVIVAGRGAHHYRLVGLDVHPADGAFLENVILLGDERTRAADVPHHIEIERCFVHGDPLVGSRRGIAMNSASTRVVDSTLSDFKEHGADAQAVAGWSGPGPFVLANDTFEAAGENVLFGGADPPSADRIPSDIRITGSHFSKPVAWRQAEWTVKNLFELKDARRVVVEGNLFEQNWPDAQNGFAILFTVRNQDGTAPWSTIEDVTFRGNVVRRSANGINVLGRDDTPGHASVRARGIRIEHNLFDEIGAEPWGGPGTLLQLLEGAADVVFSHNTALHAGNAITTEGPPHERFVFCDNVLAHNAYGIFGAVAGTGRAALARYFPGAVVRRNVLAGGPADAYPPENFFPVALEGVIVREESGAVRLSPASALRGRGTDGRDPGADSEAVRVALRAAE